MLAPVALEARVITIGFIFLGALAVFFGSLHSVTVAVLSACGVGVVFGSLLWTKWRRLVNEAMEQAEPAPSNVGIANAGSVVLRISRRAGFVLVGITAAAILMSSKGEVLACVGDGILGGIWIGTGVMFLRIAVSVKREEGKREQKFVRDMNARTWGQIGDGERARPVWRFFVIPS